MTLCAKIVGKVLNDVEAEWQNRFAFVRLKIIEVVEDRYFGYVAKGLGVGFAYVYFDELFVGLLGTGVATDGLGAVEV